ncbi:MAG TPA: tetratricopeptide repeat protein [Terricaulis sp.]|nr:tetratricopeptide repeat protein [Terricaulis sp.]
MRVKAAVAFLAVMLAACQPQGGAGPSPAEQHQALAAQCGGGDIGACTTLIDDPAIAAPQRGAYLVSRGQARRALGETTAALRDFEAALRADPNQAGASLGRGEILLESGQLDAAQPLFERALAAGPSGRASLGLARIADAHGDVPGAITHLHAALTADPNLAEAHALRARILKQSGDLEGARREYAHAIRIDSALAVARAGRCRLNLETNESLDQARDDAAAGVLADPANVEAQICRGILQLRDREAEAALASFAAALEVEPGNPEALFGHGIARMRTGDSQGSRDMNRARQFSSHIGQRFEQLGVSTR